MNEPALIAIATVVVVWALLSEWLAARNVSGPLVFLAAGLLVAHPDWGLVSIDVDSTTVHVLAEVTLALLLFGDASSVPLKAAGHDLPLTVRLLAVGLPLTVALGAVLAFFVLGDMTLALAVLVGASLAPTDAALSAVVISDERVPVQVRRVLNVESGLNDGIATPIVTFAVGSVAAALGIADHTYDSGPGALGQVAIGALVGAAIAYVGARLVVLGERRGWMQHGGRRFTALGLALLCFLVASELDANAFVAAFVGGLAFGATARHEGRVAAEFNELIGTLLSLVVWFVFGAIFVVPAVEDLDVRIVVYALASLTVIRMVPVALALIRSGEDRRTVTFIGWFGPRGLASVVFALLALEELGGTDPGVVTAIRTITITVVLSVVAHGVTARPMTARLTRSP